MNKYFVASDIHGFYSELLLALVNKGFDVCNKEHVLISLGDEFDRGNQAVELLQFLQQLKEQNRLILILGNHEDLMFDCLSQINTYRMVLGSHHYSNGTVDTISQFTNDIEIAHKLNYWQELSDSEIKKINKAMMLWKDFVKDAKSYAEIGDYIFVHGWIPTKKEKTDPFEKRKLSYLTGWRELNTDSEDWKNARWTGFVEAYKNKCFEPNKTIVCGHWHCSAYWGDIKHERKPFPEKNRSDWKKSFEPAITTEFIAIDGCTVYSGIVNVLVFEEVSKNRIELLDL